MHAKKRRGESFELGMRRRCDNGVCAGGETPGRGGGEKEGVGRGVGGRLQRRRDRKSEEGYVGTCTKKEIPGKVVVEKFPVRESGAVHFQRIFNAPRASSL